MVFLVDLPVDILLSITDFTDPTDFKNLAAAYPTFIEIIARAKKLLHVRRTKLYSTLSIDLNTKPKDLMESQFSNFLHQCSLDRSLLSYPQTVSVKGLEVEDLCPHEARMPRPSDLQGLIDIAATFTKTFKDPRIAKLLPHLDEKTVACLFESANKCNYELMVYMMLAILPHLRRLELKASIEDGNWIPFMTGAQVTATGSRGDRLRASALLITLGRAFFHVPIKPDSEFFRAMTDGLWRRDVRVDITVGEEVVRFVANKDTGTGFRKLEESDNPSLEKEICPLFGQLLLVED